MRQSKTSPRTLRIVLAVDISEAYPWHYGIYQGVRRYLSSVKGVELIIDDFPHAEQNFPPDGIIARADHKIVQWAEERGIPLINVMTYSPIVQEVVSYQTDTGLSGRMAAEHLYGRGFRRFCLIANTGRYADRVAGEAFRNFVEERNCVVEAVHIPRIFTKTHKEWQHFTTELPKAWKRLGSPFGIFTSPDCISCTGRFASDLCQKEGLRVPLDVAIVDGKNGSPFCEESPSLTAIEWDFEELGYTAAQDLHANIERGTPLESRALPPVGIVERDSTDYFATEDSIVAKAVSYISANLSSPLRVDEIAENIFVTRRTLERRFKAVAGRSVSAEIKRLRVSKAKRFMANDEFTSLKRIAYEVGFRDERRLYDAFQSLEGCSPSEFWGRLKPGK